MVALVRLWFVLGAAVVGAALADPCVEALSNLGLFGRLRLTDGSNVDVLPTLLIGACIGLAVFAGLVRMQLRDRTMSPLQGNLLPLVLPTFAAQLGVLYVMETLEQFEVLHHVLGGTIWMGGPPLVSMSIHAIFALSVTGLLSAVLRRCARRTVDAIRLIRAILERQDRFDTVSLRRRGVPRLSARISPALSRDGNRAPPGLFA